MRPKLKYILKKTLEVGKESKLKSRDHVKENRKRRIGNRVLGLGNQGGGSRQWTLIINNASSLLYSMVCSKQSTQGYSIFSTQNFIPSNSYFFSLIIWSDLCRMSSCFCSFVSVLHLGFCEEHFSAAEEEVEEGGGGGV